MSSKTERTAMICLDQFLLANSCWLSFTNKEISSLAEATAAYAENGESFHSVLEELIRKIAANLVPFSKLRTSDPQFCRALHKIKRQIRSSTLNQESAPVAQEKRFRSSKGNCG